MEQIGYSLVDADGVEIQHWGDALGQCVAIPNPIRLPDGSDVHGVAALGEIGQWRLVARYAQAGAQSATLFDGEKTVVTIAVTEAMVISERERRLASGFAFDFGDTRGVHQIGTTEQDMRGWSEVTMASQAAIALGQATAQFNIVTNTGPVSLTTQEWQQILLAAAQFRQPVWAASFALLQEQPIPSDYADNARWQ